MSDIYWVILVWDGFGDPSDQILICWNKLPLKVMGNLWRHGPFWSNGPRNKYDPCLKYLPLAFGSMNWCKINIFTSNRIVLHHKQSQNVKIKVNRYTNIYLLMNLFTIDQFILIFSYILVLYFYSYRYLFNCFVFIYTPVDIFEVDILDWYNE